MPDPLHILFLADGIYPFTIGGMQKHSTEMVKGLLKKGCSVKLIFSVAHNQSIPSEQELLQALELDKSCLSKFSWLAIKFPAPGKLPGHYLKASYRFSKEIFKKISLEIKEFDFIFAQGFTGWYLLEQKNKGTRIPLTGVHFHGLNMFQKTFGWKAKLIAKMFQKPVMKNLHMADIVFSYGGRCVEVYRKLGVESKTIYQPIGIKTALIAKQASPVHHPLKLVFIGRNDKIKGLDLLHKVIQKIQTGKFHFIFIGEIPGSIRLNRSDCSYTGLISDSEKNTILKEADVLVCPSYSEGMPYVILEAMSMGLCVLATDVGAISEMITPSNGILVEPSNADQLLQAINSLTDSDIYPLKENALQSAQIFTWDKVIGRFLKNIKESLDKRKN